jgi:hypothetical protein
MYRRDDRQRTRSIGDDSLDVSPDEVEWMTYAQLQRALSARLLPSYGKKEVLITRLKDAILSESSQSGDDYAPEAQAPDSADSGAAPEAALEDIDNMKYPELQRALASRGLPANGRKPDLLQRLKAALQSPEAFSVDYSGQRCARNSTTRPAPRQCDARSCGASCRRA